MFCSVVINFIVVINFTVVINFISRNHAFTVKRALITYGKEYQRLELLFAVKSFHSESVIRRGVKALHFRL